MKIEQRRWTRDGGWSIPANEEFSKCARLVLVFGATARMRDAERLAEIARNYPAAQFLGCSTSGEICGTGVFDDSLVVTAVCLDRTRTRLARVDLDTVGGDSGRAGKSLAAQLPPCLDHANAEWPLVHVLTLSDGLKVNGSDLVKGLTESLPAGATVTGGLAGDGAAFAETLVWTGGKSQSGVVAAVGLYGRDLRVGFGSLGGWDPFGPERLVTRSRGNILYEFDGQSALGLYKQYLGQHAAGLPATGLLFPLSVRTKDREAPVVRTILSIDEPTQSMTFAGNVPEGSYARLMKANFDRLIDGAVGAARACGESSAGTQTELAILISCVGRKLVLKQRVEEEVEGVREILGSGATLAGFYSYGEICPFTVGAPCELHNQTMTVTTLRES